MAASGADLRHLCRGLPGASTGRHYYGPLRRSGRAQEDVHPEHSADGIADAGDWSAADLRVDRHCRAAAAVADAHSAGGGYRREVPGARVFVAEHVPEKRIGIACGTSLRA